MTTRDRLHRLVDVLPEAEADTVARMLEGLVAGTLDPAARTALLASDDDDEPLTDAERAGMAEGRADLAAGRVHTAAEVRAALGLG